MILPAGRWMCFRALEPLCMINAMCFSLDSACEALYSCTQFLEERQSGIERANAIFYDDFVMPMFWKDFVHYVTKQVYHDTNHVFTFRTPAQNGIEIRSYGLNKGYMSSVGREAQKARHLWLLARSAHNIIKHHNYARLGDVPYRQLSRLVKWVQCHLGMTAYQLEEDNPRKGRPPPGGPIGYGRRGFRRSVRE